MNTLSYNHTFKRRSGKENSLSFLSGIKNSFGVGVYLETDINCKEPASTEDPQSAESNQEANEGCNNVVTSSENTSDYVGPTGQEDGEDEY